MNKSVSVIGGGVAGLSAAVFLAKEGFKINLYEASPKLGGRTYSFFDKNFGDFIDNGQHILASWYKNTFEYLKIIGSYDKLHFQKQFEVHFVNQKAEKYTLKASKLPPPLHLLKGLIDFKALKLNDRVAAIRLVNSIKSQKTSEFKLKAENVNSLFADTKQTRRLVESFWKPFIIAVFNAQPENTSAFMFSEVIKMGFLEKDGSNLVLPDVFLSKLIVEPAIDYLKECKCGVFTKRRIAKYNIKDSHVTSIIDEYSTEIESDFYISAVPSFDIAGLMNSHTKYIGIGVLSPSPIVNIHLKFGRDITEWIKERFYGILESNIQWVFRVKNDQLCLVISSAGKIADMDKAEIAHLSENELFKCFPGLETNKVIGTRVLKEMRATFLPDKESIRNRPDHKTGLDNFYFAGDWTNTGLPSTIESAVKSARICSNEIIETVKH